MEKRTKTYDEIDEALTPFSYMIELLSDIHAHTDPEVLEVMTVDEMRMDFPMEIDVLVDDEGHVTLGSAPPTQRIETTFMPVIQNMKLTIVSVSKLNGETE